MKLNFKKHKKIIIKFVVSFLSLLFIGYILQIFFSSLPKDLGPFLNGSVKLFDFFLPGPSDFFAILITTIESVLVASFINFEKKK